MNTRLLLATALASMATGILAQNELRFIDGTTEFTSRGGNSMDGKEILVRIPGDQLWGATAITTVSMVIQDQNYTTVEPMGIVVRTNDNSLVATGAPNITPAGLIGSLGPFPQNFPVPGTGTISAMVASYSFSPPLLLPTPTGVMPTSDIYVGLSFPNPAPGWPNDGISLHMSGLSTSAIITAGEQMSATTPGYSGFPGVAGMSWEITTTGPGAGMSSASQGNRAWNIGISLADDVLQPFAENALVFTSSPFPPAGTATGANPNFGYAGIFPDELRATGPDNLGFRLRATAPIGSTAYLFISFATVAPPLAVPGVGFLSLDLNLMFPGILVPLQQAATTLATGGMPATTSQVMFGPYPGFAGAAGVAIHAQCLTATPTGALRLSTISTIHL